MTTDEVCLSVLIVTIAFAGLIKAARDIWTLSQGCVYSVGEEEDDE